MSGFMMRSFQINFTAYLDKELRETNSDIDNITTVVQAMNFVQAEAMIRGMYQDRVRINSVYAID